jgi:hypothetical protein
VRLGIVANPKNDCGTPDSPLGLGFGSDGHTCVLGPFTSAAAGNVATRGDDAGDRTTRLFACLFVR